MNTTMSLFQKHEALLKDALNALTIRTYYSPYPELPAKNEPALVVMDNYIATVSCILYGKL
jgi:hypothetical protein